LFSNEFDARSRLSLFMNAKCHYPIEIKCLRLVQPYKNGKYYSALHCAYQILKKESIKSFYRGIGPMLIRTVPVNAVLFYTYEWMYSKLN